MTLPIDCDLPSGLIRPSAGSHRQPCLFRLSLREALTRLSVSEDDLHRWRTCDWLSFDWHPDELVDEFDDPKVGEIEIIRDISRSGLGDSWITRTLTQLPRPLSHPPDRLLFSFRHGWLAIETPDPVDPAQVTEAYITELMESEDRETLKDLQQRITDALEEVTRTR